MLFRDSIPGRRGEVDLVPLDQVGQFVEKGSSLRHVQCPPGTVELEGSPGSGHDLVDICLVALQHRADDLASRGVDCATVVKVLPDSKSWILLSMKMSVKFTSVLTMGGVNSSPNKSLRTRW